MTTPPAAALTTIEVVQASDSIPEFITSDPALWFIQFDATFDGRTSPAAKTRKLISKLPQCVLPQVADLLDDEASFDDIKTRLLALYGRSQEAKINSLLDGVRMGDEKPSMLLRKIQYLAGKADSAEYIKQIWLRALPPHFRTQLALSTATDLNGLASDADKLSAASSLSTRLDNSDARIATLTDQISKLLTVTETLTTAAVSNRSRSRSPIRSQQYERPRSPARQSFRPPQQFHSTPRPRFQGNSTFQRATDSATVTVCRFHQQFKEKARNCRPHCHFYKSMPKNV